MLSLRESTFSDIWREKILMCKMTEDWFQMMVMGS